MLRPSYRLFTALALLAFAANSVLCRVALRGGLIDPASFTLIRLLSGACVLAGLARLRDGAAWLRWDHVSVLALFAYAAPFSYAYLRLSTGTGALLLFGSVQATMITASVFAGERLTLSAWAGWALAVLGLIGLSWPGVSAPEPLSACWMIVAGIAWGIYTLRGRKLARDPLRSTATYFAGAVLPALALWAVTTPPAGSQRAPLGVLYAILSGAIASGVGYSLWYSALRQLSASRAALLQLLVPLIAALFGVLILGESASLRLALSGTVILGGVALSLWAPLRASRATPRPVAPPAPSPRHDPAPPATP